MSNRFALNQAQAHFDNRPLRSPSPPRGRQVEDQHFPDPGGLHSRRPLSPVNETQPDYLDCEAPEFDIDEEKRDWLDEFTLEARTWHERELEFSGLTPDHEASCVLVTEDLGGIGGPLDLQQAILAIQVDDDTWNRLPTVYIRGKHFPRGRVIAWLSETTVRCEDTWRHTFDAERHNIDLANRLETSHLCGYPSCELKAHTCLETHTQNMARLHYHQRARQDRAAGRPFAAQCTHHDPPCLLHQGALAPEEVLNIMHSVSVPDQAGLMLVPPQKASRERVETTLPLHFPSEHAGQAYPGLFTLGDMKRSKTVLQKLRFDCQLCGRITARFGAALAHLSLAYREDKGRLAAAATHSYSLEIAAKPLTDRRHTPLPLSTAYKFHQAGNLTNEVALDIIERPRSTSPSPPLPRIAPRSGLASSRPGQYSKRDGPGPPRLRRAGPAPGFYAEPPPQPTGASKGAGRKGSKRDSDDEYEDVRQAPRKGSHRRR